LRQLELIEQPLGGLLGPFIRVEASEQLYVLPRR
jgi:hypothetical protein